MNINEVDIKKWISHCSKQLTKFMGLGNLGLKLQELILRTNWLILGLAVLIWMYFSCWIKYSNEVLNLKFGGFVSFCFGFVFFCPIICTPQLIQQCLCKVIYRMQELHSYLTDQLYILLHNSNLNAMTVLSPEQKGILGIQQQLNWDFSVLKVL